MISVSFIFYIFPSHPWYLCTGSYQHTLLQPITMISPSMGVIKLISPMFKCLQINNPQQNDLLSNSNPKWCIGYLNRHNSVKIPSMKVNMLQSDERAPRLPLIDKWGGNGRASLPMRKFVCGRTMGQSLAIATRTSFRWIASLEIIRINTIFN